MTPTSPSTINKILPARTATAWNVVPLSSEGEKLRYGAAAPSEDLRINLSVLVGESVTLIPMPADQVQEALRATYGLGAGSLDETPANPLDASEGMDTNDSAMARFVANLLEHAHAERATDIHIEPEENGPQIRLRVDGLLRFTPVPDVLRDQTGTLVSRIKVMGGMNIAEKRLPQDGHIRARTGSDEIDVRVSIIPTIHGETVDLRLLPRNLQALGLPDLGMSEDIRNHIADIITRPNGIFLVTGPTGHGKTTTLYACLRDINHPTRKIITIEDPVEYRLRGISQMQVHPKIGLTFSAGLRAVLRQDPDVLMVGEIRDVDTAEIAIRSALTGHLVFSTLHTNDAVAAVARLIDIGIEPYLVAASVSAVLGQRLVRKCCENCGNAGCESCHGTGLRGRTGIFELLILNDDLRTMIATKCPVRDIRRRAVETGMRTLFQDGRMKSEAGVTTLAEIRRVAEDL